MIDRITRVFAELGNFGRRVDLHLVAELPDGRVVIARPLILETIDKAQALENLQPPALSMHPGTAQLLMDELWRIGFRPAEGTGSAGALAATEHHLKDMRRIAFALLRDEQGFAEVTCRNGDGPSISDRPPPF